ncbi:unnamed protein product [Closterium sp. NIES-54]
MAAAKRVLRYLCSTSGLGLVLGGRRPVVLLGHADASWADDQATQRSSQGYTFSLGSGSVLWRSTRSSSVLGSSYNKAMLALCREHRLEHRTKHIALRYFLARELQQRGQLCLAYVASEANTVDIFTKALPPGDHQRFCTMLDCVVFLLVPNSFASSIIPHYFTAEPPVVPLGRPLRRPAPSLPPPDIQPHRDPWDTIDWCNEPSTPRRTVYGPDPEPREPTLVRGTIPGTNIPLSIILDRGFLAMMLTMANCNDEEEDLESVRACYMRTSGFRTYDALWHQRLRYPSRVTLKNFIKAGVFAPGALMFPDGTEVRGTTHPHNCTIFLEVALSHQPFPMLEAGTNLEKVYSDFLNVGRCGVNDELYTLTFVDAGTRFVWIVNVEARSRAHEVFSLWFAHTQRQFGEKLKVRQSNGAAEFKSKELQDCLAQKRIEHHISLPYAH